MANQTIESKLWFIPIRIHSTKATRIVEAKTTEDAINQLKTSELHYKNFNKLPPDKQKDMYDSLPKSLAGIDIFELEEEYFEDLDTDTISQYKRSPEEIPQCKYRYYNKKESEYFCNGIDPREASYHNRFCIIHDQHFKFDLPEACPFLKHESGYIQFTEEDIS